MRLVFGEFVFDSGRRRLTRRGEVVHLTPKAFRLLEILIERRPNAVSKRDLYDLVWPDTVVEMSNLDTLIAQIRAALGEGSRRSRYLKTIYSFGFAFVVDDQATSSESGEAGASARFEIRRGQRAFLLHEGDNILGREGDAAVIIDSPLISRRHARITVAGDRVVLEDLGSKNGTYVAKHRIAAPTELIDGDEIRVGSVRMRFRSLGRGHTTRTQRRRR